MEVQTPGQAFAAFLGALGFTRPVEQLELRSVPLPTKKPADEDETAPQPDQSPPAKTAEAILIATRNELYGKDNPPVQEVRARLLGLDPDMTPTDAQINASPGVALSLGSGGEGCTRHNNRSLDTVLGGERPAG